ncbi:MAG: glycosyltransferase family 1 protein [Candidatus Omnitrophota bacterium]
MAEGKDSFVGKGGGKRNRGVLCYVRMKKRFLVGLDGHALGQEQGGNESYLFGLLEGINEISPPEFQFLLFLAGEKKPIIPFSGGLDFETEKISLQPFRRLFFDLPRQTFLKRLDLLHTQYHLPVVSRCPEVITLHDVSFLRYSQLIPKREYWKMKSSVGYAVRKAKKVITVSEFSRKEILFFYRLKPEKVEVIYNGISKKFVPVSAEKRAAVLGKYGITKPYVFSVASLHPRKNFSRLILAFVSLCSHREGFDYNLVLGGRNLWLYEEILAKARHSRYKDRIIFTGYLPDEDLSALYSFAEVFVYPSLYEGFGFAPMEAMACGCPVVTSNISALPEVTGGAAILVDPQDVDAIAKGILDVITNPELKKGMRERSLDRAQKFTWADSAEKALQVYEEILRR